MLVANSCANDTRVIRAAETVADQGFETVVLAISDDDTTSDEHRKGVTYKRIGRSAAPRTTVAAGEAQGIKIKVRDALSGWPALQTQIRSGVHVSQRLTRILLRPLRVARSGLRRSLLPRLPSLVPLRITRHVRSVFAPDLIRLKPDIIHAHDLATLPAGASAAKALGAKLIYDAHELEVHRNTKAGRTDKWMRYYLERKHIKACDAVITVCDSIADYLAREYAIERPVVVMNSPDAESATPCDTDLRTSLSLANDVPLAVYVGRITIGRGIEQIVDALQHLPEFHLALVGPVNKPTVEEALARAKALGIAERLHIVDPVAPDKVISFIGSGDVSVVPIQNVCLSYYYCLPNKLLESAIARLPVVVSNLPELRRFVEISKAGVVMDETDPRDIANAMQSAYENRDRLRPDADRLRQAEEIYGWQTQKEALQALYASLDGRDENTNPNTMDTATGGTPLKA